MGRGSTKARREAAFEKVKGKKPLIPKPKTFRGVKAVTQRYGVQCGAKKKHHDPNKGNSRCQMPAGWGTPHPGTGKCKFHGGSSPQHVKAAASTELRVLLGKELEMNPFEAIMWCIRIRAGEVQWLSEQMATLEEKEWVEESLMGKQFHLYAKERQAAMGDLVRYSQIAISMGIAERYVRLAEVYGNTIAKLIEGVLGRLDLTEEQKTKAPQAIRAELLLMKADQTNIIEGEAKELPEKTAA